MISYLIRFFNSSQAGGGRRNDKSERFKVKAKVERVRAESKM